LKIDSSLQVINGQSINIIFKNLEKKIGNKKKQQFYPAKKN